MDDALDFYEKAECSHIARASYYGDGADEEIFYANKPEEYKGDPDTGMDIYNIARSYSSFIDGSVEAPDEEFSYIPGFRIIKRK